MAKIRPRVKVPKKAKVGEVVTIKTLLSHPMETGHRKDAKTGELIPRDLMNYFSASFNGEKFFEVEVVSALSRNPYIEFTLKVPEAGTVSFLWKTDNDGEFSTKKKIKIV